MKTKILWLALGFFLVFSLPINIFGMQKNFDESTKINNDVNDLGFDIDSSVKQENYIVCYTNDSKKNIVAYSVLKNNILTFRAPKTAAYELINNVKNFLDVKEYSEDIAFVTSRELFNGVDKNIFAPNNHMSRAMFVQVIANLEGVDLSNYKVSNFSDVDQKAWYSPAIAWAVSQNLIINCDDSLSFSPNAPISREDMVSILYRYSQNKHFLLWQPGLAVARPPFADIDKISDYARQAVTKLNWSGIVLSKINNNFEPKSFATRSEVSALLKRFVERMTELN